MENWKTSYTIWGGGSVKSVEKEIGNLDSQHLKWTMMIQPVSIVVRVKNVFANFGKDATRTRTMKTTADGNEDRERIKDGDGGNGGQ